MELPEQKAHTEGGVASLALLPTGAFATLKVNKSRVLCRPDMGSSSRLLRDSRFSSSFAVSSPSGRSDCRGEGELEAQPEGRYFVVLYADFLAKS